MANPTGVERYKQAKAAVEGVQLELLECVDSNTGEKVLMTLDFDLEEMDGPEYTISVRLKNSGGGLRNSSRQLVQGLVRALSVKEIQEAVRDKLRFLMEEWLETCELEARAEIEELGLLKDRRDPSEPTHWAVFVTKGHGLVHWQDGMTKAEAEEVKDALNGLGLIVSIATVAYTDRRYVAGKAVPLRKPVVEKADPIDAVKTRGPAHSDGEGHLLKEDDEDIPF